MRVCVVRQTEGWKEKSHIRREGNLIGRVEAVDAPFGYIHDTNGFLVQTCLLGITALKYDLIAPSSCSQVEI